MPTACPVARAPRRARGVVSPPSAGHRGPGPAVGAPHSRLLSASASSAAAVAAAPGRHSMRDRAPRQSMCDPSRPPRRAHGGVGAPARCSEAWRPNRCRLRSRQRSAQPLRCQPRPSRCGARGGCARSHHAAHPSGESRRPQQECLGWTTHSWPVDARRHCHVPRVRASSIAAGYACTASEVARGTRPHRPPPTMPPTCNYLGNTVSLLQHSVIRALETLWKNRGSYYYYRLYDVQY